MYSKSYRTRLDESHQGHVDHPSLPDVHDARGRQELVLPVDVLDLAAETLQQRHPESRREISYKMEVVVAQLVEQSVPTPEVRSSYPVIGKIYCQLY